MSTNCVRCVQNKRTGPDLMCDVCRSHDTEMRKLRAELLATEMGRGAWVDRCLKAEAELADATRRADAMQAAWEDALRERDAARREAERYRPIIDVLLRLRREGYRVVGLQPTNNKDAVDNVSDMLAALAKAAPAAVRNTPMPGEEGEK